jgi:glycosyltransferase involved in cell wall biosynthesis
MDKRILIFSTAYYPVVGGAEVALKELTDRMPSMRFDLVCARLKKGLADHERIGNVEVYRVGFGYSFDKYLLPFLGPMRAYRIAHNVNTTVWSMMASYAGFASLFYCWMRPSTKLLLTLQEGDPLEKYAKRLGVFGFLQRAIFRRANRVQAISRFLGEWAVRAGHRHPVEIIPNGVDINSFSKPISAERRRELRTGLGFTVEDIVLVTASRLSLKNAVDDVIRALPALSMRVKFLVIGVGEDEAMLRTLTDELGVNERVVFAGYRSHAELPELLRASEIFIRPSLSEGLGNAFLEAMAADVPIIGTPVGGIPDFLADGQTGILCEPRNPESIVKAVDRLLAEPGLRSRVVEQGAKLVRDRYDWASIADRMKSLLLSL